MSHITAEFEIAHRIGIRRKTNAVDLSVLLVKIGPDVPLPTLPDDLSGEGSRFPVGEISPEPQKRLLESGFLAKNFHQTTEAGAGPCGQARRDRPRKPSPGTPLSDARDAGKRTVASEQLVPPQTRENHLGALVCGQPGHTVGVESVHRGLIQRLEVALKQLAPVFGVDPQQVVIHAKAPRNPARQG